MGLSAENQTSFHRNRRGSLSFGSKQTMSRAREYSIPSSIEWIVAVFMVLLQQGAFVSLPLVISNRYLSSVRTNLENPFNTVGIAASIILVTIVCLPHLQKLSFLLVTNVTSILFLLLVLFSAIWSLHPDITITRGVGYVLTLAIAAYLAVRFDSIDRMKVLSWSFAISGIGSLLFILGFPEYGIMQISDAVEGWRGVFPHKEVFGPVMAVAAFTESYLLIATSGRQRWRFGLLIFYFVLILLSHAATALVLVLFYGLGAGCFFLWRRDRIVGVAVLVIATLLIFIAAIFLWFAPDATLALLGKDTTLTGRTELWSLMITFVREKPLLGWGYQGLWGIGDVPTMLVDEVINWGAISSHNAFLEITLQLGLVGLGIMLLIIGVALRRGFRCCAANILPLGFFSLMFFVGAILAGQTLDWTLGRHQVIEWLVFNVLNFSCGLNLASRAGMDNAAQRATYEPVGRRPTW